jgi:DNA-binding MarR family transcriptional regulator
LANSDTGVSWLDSDSELAARRLLRVRQERARHFAPVEMVDAAWDLLLVLFGARKAATTMRVGDLAALARVPRTTAVRWLRQLETHGFVCLAGDPDDKRAVRAELTERGGKAMKASFAAAKRSGGATRG